MRGCVARSTENGELIGRCRLALAKSERVLVMDVCGLGKISAELLLEIEGAHFAHVAAGCEYLTAVRFAALSNLLQAIALGSFLIEIACVVLEDCFKRRVRVGSARRLALV